MTDKTVTDKKGDLQIARQLCFALYATSRSFTKAYGEILGDLGLTYPQYLAMLVLWEQDGLRVQEVAAKMEIEGATATPLIQRLEKLGLVKRERSSEDERQVLVFLTEQGYTLFQKAQLVPEKIGSIVGVEAPQAARLINELEAIRKQIET